VKAARQGTKGRKGNKTQAVARLGVLEIVFDPFVPAPIFVLEIWRRRTRGALAVVRDEADNFRNIAE
jgi:hypothetical protein